MNAFMRGVLRFLERWCPYWKQPGATTFFIATMLHLVEGTVMLVTDTANRSTPIAALLHNLLGMPGLPIETSVMIQMYVVAALALISMNCLRLNHWLACLLLLPQQALLAVTCIGALVETWNGTYADGYAAPQAFILVDQLTRILLAPAYTYAIFLRALWSPDGGSANIRASVCE